MKVAAPMILTRQLGPFAALIGRHSWVTAWGGNPDCNLYSQEGLPASPFRTDDWRGVTTNGK
jgi:hypothetical protein